MLTRSVGEPAGRITSRVQLDWILMLCTQYVIRYPSETMWQRLRALSQLGRVVVLPAFETPRQVLAPPTGVELLPAGRGPRLIQVLRYAHRAVAQLERLRATGQCGLIWTEREPFLLRAAARLRRTYGIPMVADIWDVPDLSRLTQWRERHWVKAAIHGLLGWGVRASLACADLVVWTLAPGAMRRYLPPEQRNVLWLPNGIAYRELAGRMHTGSCAQPFDGKQWRLLYVGYFHRSRGSDLLTELARQLGPELPAVVEVVGPLDTPAARRACERARRRAGLWMKFYGPLRWEDTQERIHQAHICLYPFPDLPELRFIYPLKLLEYAAANKWIVASDLPGARELLDGYSRVHFCHPADFGQWVSAVRRIARTTSEGNDRVTAFRASELDWELIHERLLERLTAVMEATRNG